ncbi:hypothetical protein ALC57_00393, partial [Trachymyrmex cornetzi]
NYVPSLEEQALLHEVDTLDVVDIIEDEGLKYIAGYVAYRFMHKYKDLGTSTEMLINPENDWINYISRGRLISPSSHLHEVAKAMNIEFQTFHGTFIRKDPWIFKTVADKTQEKIQNIQIPREVLLCLVRISTMVLPFYPLYSQLYPSISFLRFLSLGISYNNKF